MLFPTNPEKRQELWTSFSNKLEKGKILFIVHEGKLFNIEMNEFTEDINSIINSFRSADIVRFVENHGHAIGPFFALRITGEIAYLVEYAIDTSTQSSSDKDIQEALQSLAINLFFERKDITEISLPFSLSRWDLAEWKVVERDGHTSLQRSA